MGTKARSFTLAAAAVLVLSLGTPAPNALAQNDRRSGGDRQHRQGQSESRRSFGRQLDRRPDERRQGERFERRSFGRPYGWGYPDRFDNRVFVPPYRTVRVFVAFPYPHWVLRRVYDDRAVVYGPDCDPY